MGIPQLDGSTNRELIAPFSEEEIRMAVWNCESTKSPGLDGVNFAFIK